MITAHNAIHATGLGPRARRLVRFIARFVNPIVMLIAGRRWMPVVGILHHRGRRSGRAYATPLGMRPLGDSFVMPRTFGEDAAWYRNVLGGRRVRGHLSRDGLYPGRARGRRLRNGGAGLSAL